MPFALDLLESRFRKIRDLGILDRYRLLGFIGAAALALGGCAIGALPANDPFTGVPVIHELRQAPVVALAVAYSGLALLVVAWLFLGRLVSTPNGPRLTSLTVTLGLWALPLAVAPPMFSKDVYSYAAQGWLVQQGSDPYFWGPAAVPGPFLPDVGGNWIHTPAPYGPVFLVLARWVVGLGGGHVIPTVLGLRVLALLGVLLLVRYVPRLAVHCGVAPERALWLGGLNPLVLLHFVSGAHNDALLVGLIVAGLVLALDGRVALGVVACAVAVLIKAPAAALALVFLIPLWAGQLRGRFTTVRAAAGTGVLAGGTIAGITWLSGLGYGWISALQTPGAVRNWLSPMTVLGEATGGLAKAVGLTDKPDTAIAVFRGAGGLVALVICLLLLARHERYGIVGALGLALTTVVVLSPVVQPWYLLWGFMLIAAGIRTPGTRTVVVSVSAVLSMLLMPKGGTLDVSDVKAIWQAVPAGLVVGSSLMLFEMLPLPGRPTSAAAEATAGTVEA